MMGEPNEVSRQNVPFSLQTGVKNSDIKEMKPSEASQRAADNTLTV